jgi:predicted dehydrogenase/threonine dehydrogenase-like Zn-dependent dehydrogenase
MRQILCNSDGALVARVPRPAPGRGQVLIRVQYSLISVGTEIAALRPQPVAATDDSLVTRAAAHTRLARTYLGLALRNPGKATRRVGRIAKGAIGRVLPARPTVVPVVSTGAISWSKADAARVEEIAGGGLEVDTDSSPSGYQVMSGPIAVPSGLLPVIAFRGRIHAGGVAIGVLSEARDTWLGVRSYVAGTIDDRLLFAPGESQHITVVIANDGATGITRLTLDEVQLTFVEPTENGLPASELEQQGWNVGYSAAGEVLAVGEGIVDLAPGDRVACAGAGKANHADYVCVPRNLVSRVPDGCSIQAAATTTVGTIALQGVRRAAPQLGERICVLGLGLIGQLTVQMLRASGCRVLGLDLSEARVQRALATGLEIGASDEVAFRTMVRDLTGGQGADRTLITASTKSDSVINLAMEITRAKGTVVVVGDVGLNVDRAAFYRREIDLLMSTSYGPGRYDRGYEEQGLDYPFAHVRWTLNRNMQAYLQLIVDKRLDVDGLIDRIVPIDEAHAIYEELRHDGAEPPLGVLLRYLDERMPVLDSDDDARVTIRGHRPSPKGVARYALVGAGAFGLSMLVPQMAKRNDRFFLRGIVSRSGVQASNFARANQLEVLASDLGAVLADPEFDLVVIATRHDQHADQVVQAIGASKHVFVEKPLALSWDQLDRVVHAYESAAQAPQLLVGFNRRFSPAVQRLKECLAERRSPLIINYRLNGGYIPLDSWIQDEQGGGRNIGEACHMYDVFRTLAGAPVTSISASAITPGDLPYMRSDNFVATLSYADGSVCNLVYTALGPKVGLPKEHVEVFCDGEAYVIEDYRRLFRCSDSATLWQAAEADKGHFEQLCRFGDAIHEGTQGPIPFDEIIETSAVALHVEDLLFGRTHEDADD